MGNEVDGDLEWVDMQRPGSEVVKERGWIRWEWEWKVVLEAAESPREENLKEKCGHVPVVAALE